MKRLSSLFGSAVVQGLLIIIACTIVASTMTRWGPLLTAEQFALDARMMFIRKPSLGLDPNIVVVKIDDQTLDQFPYRSPIDRAFLAGLVTTLARKQVKVIGLDVLFDKQTEPAKDELMRQALRHLPVPIMVSYVTDPRLFADKHDFDFLQNFVPPEARAMANVITEKDGTVRGIYPGEVGPDGRYIPGLARGMLQRIGVQTPAEEVPLNYRPLLDNGKSLMDYKDKQPFREFSASVVPFLPTAWFKGKIVLVGADLTLEDRHRTPAANFIGDINGKIPGVLLFAHAMAQYLSGDNIKFVPFQGMLLMIGTMALLGVVFGRINLPVWAQFTSSGVAIILYWIGALVLYYESGLVVPMIAPALAILMAAWITDTLVGRQFRAQRNFIQGAMGRLVSPKIVKELVENPEMMSVGATRREMTYLFTDVASFTSMAEAVGAERLTGLINAYLEGLCTIIQERDGTVCRFIGDAVFALWNSPSEQTDHHARAVDCALAIDAYAESYSAEQRAKGIPFLHTRIGVHSDDAMVGFFGAHDRMEYTALGDAVNLSSRLESVNKFFGTRICVSESVVEHVPHVRFRPIAEVIVKGKTVPMAIFEPYSEARVASGYADRYDAAYRLMENEDPAALAALEALADEEPGDGCVAYHVKRYRNGDKGVHIHMDEK